MLCPIYQLTTDSTMIAIDAMRKIPLKRLLRFGLFMLTSSPSAIVSPYPFLAISSLAGPCSFRFAAIIAICRLDALFKVTLSSSKTNR